MRIPALRPAASTKRIRPSLISSAMGLVLDLPCLTVKVAENASQIHTKAVEIGLARKNLGGWHQVSTGAR